MDDEPKAYRATSLHGYPRGPWRATRAEALRDCPASGRVVQVDGSALLDERAIPWGVVDVVFSSGEALHPDGIDVVFAAALVEDDERLIVRAYQALKWRWRA